jgi:hypothetical protein
MLMTGLKAMYIGEELGNEQKFLIAQHKMESPRLKLFNLYSVELWPGYREEPGHAKIVQGFEIDPETVIGGGRVRRPSFDEVVLYGQSGTYGSVPARFLEFFRADILKEYKQKLPGIERLVIDVPEKSKNDDKVVFLDQFDA